MPEKTRWKPGNLVLPAPAALVSCRGGDGRDNLITIAWCGNICSTPAMLSISIMPSRLSHGIITASREFVVNLPGRKLARAVDYCGVVSGRDRDKWADCSLTRCGMEGVSCPAVAEAPINIACRVTDIISLGSHDMFLATVGELAVDSSLIDTNNRFLLEKANLLCYAHGHYFTLGERQGHFGWSIRKKKGKKTQGKSKRPK